MTLLRSIGRVASSLSIPIASFSFAALVVSGANYCSHNNVRYLDKGFGRNDRHLVCKKADGLLGNTEINFYERTGKIDVKRCSTFLEIKHYTDEDGDWYVDNFSIYKGLFHIRGPDYVYLNRDEDFLGNERLFEEADRDLEKQLQRFKPLIEKQL